MRITTALKAYAHAKGWTAADAADNVVKSVVLEKLGSGDMPSDKFAELTKEPASPGQAGLSKALAQMGIVPANPAASVAVAPPAAGNDPLSLRNVNVLDSNGNATGGDAATFLVGAATKAADRVRVIPAIEQYQHTRSALIFPQKNVRGGPHSMAGDPVIYSGRHLHSPSDRDKAIAGAYFKFALSTSTAPNAIPRGLRLTDHDKDIVQWALRNTFWSGIVGLRDRDEGVGRYEIHGRKLDDMEIKALIDDSTSGGIEIAPIEFDDMLVTTPVLYGELFPKVNVVNVARGRRMKGGSIGNPTFTSGTAEGTAIGLFTTDAYVSAFDTNIYNAVAAMEIGMDFEEDSPTNVGQIILEKYGEKHLEWLDEQIAMGDGTTEPQGILNASSTTAVLSDNGSNGPPTVSDYEALMFGVTKAFRNGKGKRNVFIANDTTYRRARGIEVSASDQRRVFGLTHADYRLLDHDYCIQNSLGNAYAMYANLSYYRMYRRMGMTVRMEDKGQTLALKNTRLIVVRMRWGGKLELGGAASICSDMQS